MKTTVIGLFNKTKQASVSIKALEEQGVKAQSISMLTTENIDIEAFEISENTKLPEAAGIGAATGGALGLIVGGLAAVGSVATGGVGLLASGPIVASLTAGAFGAYGGGILGAILGTIIPGSDHQAILDELEKGAVLLGVECESDEQAEMIKLLKSQNAKAVQVVNFDKLAKVQEH